jgi:3-hydroxy-9,10-secoandrosta-1,3,5(10)-triene-9,17-dione monooxygenase reductase component
MSPAPLDPRNPGHYREALGAVPTSVAIIATVTEDGPAGVAVGSFVSVSLDPPLVGFFIAHSSTTWPRIRPTGGFSASVLSATQEAVCRVFATRGADKFGECAWSGAPSGRPVIDGAVAWFDCEIESASQAGDHDLVLGRVEAMHVDQEAEPLVFMGGAYGRAIAFPKRSNEWE